MPPKVGQRATSENAKAGAQPNTPIQPKRPVTPKSDTDPMPNAAAPAKAGPFKAAVEHTAMQPKAAEPLNPSQTNANPVRVKMKDLQEQAEGETE